MPISASAIANKTVTGSPNITIETAAPKKGASEK